MSALGRVLLDGLDADDLAELARRLEPLMRLSSCMRSERGGGGAKTKVVVSLSLDADLIHELRSTATDGGNFSAHVEELIRRGRRSRPTQKQAAGK